MNEEWELFGFWVGSESVTTYRTASWGDYSWGWNHCAWNPEETALNIAFLLLHGGRSADKIRTRLEGQRERNFHSGACRHLRSTQHWMKLSFLSSFPSWKSPSLGTIVPVSQVFTNLPAALRWVIHPRVQFPISWMRETGLAPEHLFQTEAQCQSVDQWLWGGYCWRCWGCLWWAGGCNCLVMFMRPGLRTGSGRPLGTQLLWHRTLEALPCGAYHHLGSVGWDQVVISQKLPMGSL